MVGVKRPVDARDERNGKRTKTKTVVPVTTKKTKSAPAKSSKKDAKVEKKDKKSSKKKVVEESEGEDEDEDEDDFDIDDVSDSEIGDFDEDEDVEMGGEIDEVEEEEEEEEAEQKSKAASTKPEPVKSMGTPSLTKISGDVLTQLAFLQMSMPPVKHTQSKRSFSKSEEPQSPMPTSLPVRSSCGSVCGASPTSPLRSARSSLPSCSRSSRDV